MRYRNLKLGLIKKFRSEGFEKLFNENKVNSKTIIVKSDDVELGVSFPGYKTKIDGNIIKAYDYKVELNEIAISHVNIVVDLFNKVVQAPHLKNSMEKFLIDVANNGDKVSISKYEDLLKYNFRSPSERLKENIQKFHNIKKKKYLIEGNIRNLTLEELKILITIIVLQEDINYPIEKGYNGRKMSFYRYIEVINGIELNEVISRTLSHQRPKLYTHIDYSKIESLI